jgi:hypothetical protein
MLLEGIDAKSVSRRKRYRLSKGEASCDASSNANATKISCSA